MAAVAGGRCESRVEFAPASSLGYSHLSHDPGLVTNLSSPVGRVCIRSLANLQFDRADDRSLSELAGFILTCLAAAIMPKYS